MYIVVYRPHGEFNLNTKYYGHFESYNEAEIFLESLPAIGIQSDPDANPGVKFIKLLNHPADGF